MTHLESETEKVEHEELDLTKAEGFELFLKSVDDVYAVIVERDTAFSGGPESKESVVQAKEVRDKLKGLILTCRDQIRDQNEEPTGDQVVQMQDMYDELIRLRNHIQDTYEMPPSQSEDAKESNVSSTESSYVEANQATSEKVDLKEPKLCGLSLPIAGPAGIKSVQTFREGLMMARDRHSLLRQSPEKQILIDKLIRKLGNIPKEGLNVETDLPAIRAIAEQINIEEVDTTAKESPASTSVPSEKNPLDFGISRERKRKKMSVVSEDRNGQIPISIAAETKLRFQPKETSPLPSEKRSKKESSRERVEKEHQSVVAAGENSDPVNTAVPDRIPDIPTTEPVHEKTSLTSLYLAEKQYQSFIETHYTSLAAFERLLDNIVTQIEKSTTDVFDRWLNDSVVSPFAFFQDQTIHEILELAAHKDARSLLQAEGIKYETFLAWIDLIGEMQVLAGEDLDQTLGGLFARWVVESEMRQVG